MTPATLISPSGGKESHTCMHKEVSRAGPVVVVGPFGWPHCICPLKKEVSDAAEKESASAAVVQRLP